ncbi:MAG: class I SAM-dependent methyltransferase, partial [Candidatus Auribacterota bacterium]|nr:class I SAM-dependent methyltransferase [Candidatus Auribacterota bacterium]
MKKIIETGIKAGDVDMYDEDALWIENSSDKIDIGDVLMEVIRNLQKELPLSRELRAISIGSGSEPQFKILEAAFKGGLYLLDIDPVPLHIVKERLRRQWIRHVKTITADYNKVLMVPEKARQFFQKRLGGTKLDLVTLDHSLYYCAESAWEVLFANLYRTILARRGAIHAVLMASKSDDQYSTTWLYNHFAGKYFGEKNDQDLAAFAASLRKNKLFQKARIISRKHRVKFFIDDFGKFMAVIWMILLYPNVHDYSPDQKEEITEYI